VIVPLFRTNIGIGQEFCQLFAKIGWLAREHSHQRWTSRTPWASRPRSSGAFFAASMHLWWCNVQRQHDVCDVGTPPPRPISRSTAWSLEPCRRQPASARVSFQGYTLELLQSGQNGGVMWRSFGKNVR